jgi:8-oxo-dGTP pyrophosphatase MutT (NUDIX family)
MRERIIHCLRPTHQLPAAVQRPKTARIGDFDLNPDRPRVAELTRAAVLVPLVKRPRGFTVLLTQRTEHLHDHAGQISFPGGRVEVFDKDAVDTALRETEEEISLERHFAEVIGLLDTYETATGYVVTPVVAFVTTGFVLQPDAYEVAEVFEVPLSFILNPKNHRTESAVIGGQQRTFYVFRYKRRFIWGATAGMLMNLCRRISG